MGGKEERKEKKGEKGEEKESKISTQEKSGNRTVWGKVRGISP